MKIWGYLSTSMFSTLLTEDGFEREQGRDRTPCILPWSISEPVLYGVLSRGYVSIPGNQLWSLKWAHWWVASGYVCPQPAREVPNSISCDRASELCF